MAGEPYEILILAGVACILLGLFLGYNISNANMFQTGILFESLGWIVLAYGFYSRRKEEQEDVQLSLTQANRRIANLEQKLEQKEKTVAVKEENSMLNKETVRLENALIGQYSKDTSFPRFKMDRKIAAIMKAGKSREEALAKLYDEEIGSAHTSGNNNSGG